jgi:hypothetical protein
MYLMSMTVVGDMAILNTGVPASGGEIIWQFLQLLSLKVHYAAICVSRLSLLLSQRLLVVYGKQVRACDRLAHDRDAEHDVCHCHCTSWHLVVSATSGGDREKVCERRQDESASV